MLVKLRDFYEARGFMFVWDDHNGAGVFWKRKERRKGPPDRRGSGDGGPIEASTIAGEVMAVIPWVFDGRLG